MWGGAPHPGREKFSLHPRHVCDVPKGDADAGGIAANCRPTGDGARATPTAKPNFQASAWLARDESSGKKRTYYI